ncbi:MAG TPA: ATP-binding cassette domain-containing protein, partial [Planctomycetaceae bacterium]
MAAPTAAPVLDVRGLKTYFRTDDGVVRAVDDVSLAIRPGQTLGLVGESGSGKSVTSLSVMRLLPEHAASVEAGEIVLLGRDVVRLPEREMRQVRGRDAAMIFQEPGTSLNPVYRVGDQVAEAIRLHQKVGKAEALRRAVELFKEVGIPEPERRVLSYPHEMSGGQKQRVMIAMALSCNPKLLIADEPTTALDVTIQAQILDLIRKLRDERGMAVLFITHDLGVIAEIADHVAVMFRGKVVETGTVEEIFADPKHPYTKGLLACRPRLETKYKRLPTVADFMTVTERPDGSVQIVEKPLTEERIAHLAGRGRGRLLHPKAELAAVGHPFDPAMHPADTTTVPDGSPPLLAVHDLKVHFPIRKGVFSRVSGYVKAVDGVSFNVYRGQTLGLVGESGCGKTTTGRAILRLIPITSGTVRFEDRPLSELEGGELRALRRKLQIIFQDPYSSLNPRMTVEAMLTEPMGVHKLYGSRSDRRDRAAALLREVGLL